MNVGDLYRCISNFNGVASNELTVDKDDIVQVHSVIDRHWIQGESRAGIGKVPSRILVHVPIHVKEGCPLFVSSDLFTASQADDLGFFKGEVIMGINAIDDDWWYGETSGRTGMFPLNHVWRVNIDIIKHVEMGERPVNLKARVTISVRAQLPEELDLYAGDIVHITHIVDTEYYRGESNGATGIFPSSFVELLNEGTTDADASVKSAITNFVPTSGIQDGLHFYVDEENLAPTCIGESRISVYANVPNGAIHDRVLPPVADTMSIVTQANRNTDEPLNFPKMSSHWKTLDVDDADLLSDDYFRRNIPGWFQNEDSRQLSTVGISDIFSEHGKDGEALVPSGNNFMNNNFISKDLGAFEVSMKKPVDRTNSLSQEVNDYFSQNFLELRDNVSASNQSNADPSDLLFSAIYNADNTGIEPYGKAIFSFSAQYPNELSFCKGDIVHLLRHVDSHWTQGRVGLATGIFPTSYLDVIVDCPHNAEEVFLARQQSSEPCYLGHAQALFDFSTTQPGDVSMEVGDTVKVLKYVDDNWVIVESVSGSKGMCPRNYLTMLVMPEPAESVSLVTSRIGEMPELLSKTRSRSVSPYQLGKRRSYNKDDFGLIRSQAVDDVLAKNMAGLDVSLNAGQPPKSMVQISVFEERGLSHISYPLVSADVSLLGDTAGILPLSSESDLVHRSDLTEMTKIENISVIKAEDSQASHVKNNRESPLSPRPPVPSRPCQADTIYAQVQKNQKTVESQVAECNVAQVCSPILQERTDSVGSATSASFPKDITSTAEDINVHKNVSRSNSVPQRPAPPPPPWKKGEEEERHYSEVSNENFSSELHIASVAVSTLNDDSTLAPDLGRSSHQRRELVQEMVTTEHEYIHDLQALEQVVQGARGRPELRTVDMTALLGNLSDVVTCAKEFLRCLQMVAFEDDWKLLVGKVFLQCSEELCRVYKVYCSNHTLKVEPLLKKYASEEEPSAFMLWVLQELQQHKIQLMDMRSVLIKPVQRVLKYPLFLDRLVEVTPTCHPDYVQLAEAKLRMANIAKEINDYTKRLDLVSKYRIGSDQSFHSVIQRMSIHSMAKKSARLSTKLSEILGIMVQTKDPQFEQEETKFRCLQICVVQLTQDVRALVHALRLRQNADLEIAEGLLTVLPKTTGTEVVLSAIAEATKNAGLKLQNFETIIRKRVLGPGRMLAGILEAPDRLIQKRHDKLLDYDSAQYKLDKNRDPGKTRILEEELFSAKGTYEALNTQLLMELPQLTQYATEVVVAAFRTLVAARMNFQGHLAKFYLQMAIIPGLSMQDAESVVSQFQKSQLQAINQLHKLTFTPPNYFPWGVLTPPREGARARSKGRKSIEEGATGSHRKQRQLEVQKKLLIETTASDKLFVVRENQAKVDPMDLSLNDGDVVVILKKKDPLGNDRRWFVDDGEHKGFVNSHCLRPYRTRDASNPRRSIDSACPIPSPPSPLEKPSLPPKVSSTSMRRATTQGHLCSEKPVPEHPPRYEDLFPVPGPVQQELSRETKQTIDNSSAELLSLKTTNVSLPSEMENGIAYYSCAEIVQPEENIYEEIFQDGHTSKESNDISSDLCQLENSQVASPVYECICDPTTPAEVGAGAEESVEAPDPMDSQFYYAKYNFGGSDTSQLNLKEGQVVLLLNWDSPQWWFVEERSGVRGYVPSSYLKRYS